MTVHQVGGVRTTVRTTQYQVWGQLSTRCEDNWAVWGQLSRGRGGVEAASRRAAEARSQSSRHQHTTVLRCGHRGMTCHTLSYTVPCCHSLSYTVMLSYTVPCCHTLSYPVIPVIPCLLILVINCQKGHMCLWKLCSALKTLKSKVWLNDQHYATCSGWVWRAKNSWNSARLLTDFCIAHV